MFYSHDILQKRGGKFGIVWVAATRSSELTRREYMSVRVRRTCDDIIDYILLRVPSTTRGRTRPRFSLYLSATLMYGTVKVFRKQHQFLYDDTSTLWSRLRMSGLKTSTFDIDLKLDTARQNVPDLVGTVDPLSADYNYTFGMWDLPSQDMSLIEQDMWQGISMSPPQEVQLSPLPLSMQDMLEDALKSPHTVSKPEDIRLKEDDSLASERIQVPDEKELPGFDGKDIEMTEDKSEEIPIEIADLIFPMKTRSRSTSSMSDIMPVIQEEEAVLRPVIETPSEKTDNKEVPARRKLPESPGVTPIQPEEPSRKRHHVRPSLTMELDPVAPGSVTRRRKRRLKFIDIETQISKKQLKHNMVTSKDICRTNILPSTRPSLPEELFSRPCKKELCHPKLLRLWTRNAVMGEEIDDTPWTVAELMKSPDEFPESRQTRRRLSPILDMESPKQVLVPPTEKSLSDIDLGLKPSPLKAAEQSSDSDKSTRARRSKRLTPQPSAEKQVEEGDSMEVARGDSVLSLERSRQRDMSIEIDHSLERSREKNMEDSILSRPRSRRGSDQLTSEEEILVELVQEQDGMSGLLPLETVQEEQEVVPPVVRSPSSESNYPEEMMRHVEQRTVTKTWTRFHTICGTHNTFRSYAAKMFNAVLDLCGNQTLEAKQKEAYGDIYLRRGRNW